MKCLQKSIRIGSFLPAEVIEQVEIEIKYEGYIERQKRQVDQYKKMEKHKIPDWMDYDEA